MSSSNDPFNSWNAKTESEKNGIGCLVLIAIGLLFWLGLKFCSNGTNSSSTTIESQSESYTGRYKVSTEVIFAAVSPTAFDMMINCITTNDKATLAQMISSGDLIYLRKGDVVLLYEAHMKYFIVRREGSTQLLYVIHEQLVKE
ncbi:MAG: hypothetical protein M0P66_00240 [Salinivirgaceae bacterium]|nr:hypothetical protein [Salinivirgaceae bacterium]